jgi:hypothetical protein
MESSRLNSQRRAPRSTASSVRWFCAWFCSASTLHTCLRCGRSKTLHNHTNPHETKGIGLKAAWFGAELFGNIKAAVKGGKAQEEPTSTPSTSAPVRDTANIVAAIRADYAADYFISGCACASISRRKNWPLLVPLLIWHSIHYFFFTPATQVFHIQ